jgi:hypothetical protein
MNNPALIVRPRAELAEWRAFQLESRILAEVYVPLWYHFNASMAGHKDIAVFVLSHEEKIEMLSSVVDYGEENGIRDEMSQMIAEFWSGHEMYRLGVKQREPSLDYQIGIDCPNQWGQQPSLYRALIDNYDCYSDIVRAIDRLVEITKMIYQQGAAPQWLTIGIE